MRPKVSVIVPVYNMENYLHACVNSILKQTFTDLEVILINDGSSDNSGAICDAFAQEDSRVRVIHQANAGLGMTRNKGLSVAQGEFIGFIDSDDVIEADFYEELVRYTADNEVEAVLCGNTDVYADKIIETKHLLAGRILDHEGIVNELLPTMLGYDKYCVGYSGMAVCNGIYLKETVDRYEIAFRSEREIISEDAVFNIEFFSKCRKMAVSESVGYLYYHRNNNSLSSSYSPERFGKYEYLYNYELDILKKLGIQTAEIKLRVQSMFIANCRVVIMQECASTNSVKVKQQNIKKYLSDPVFHKVLKEYNYASYPLKLRFFTFCMEKKKAWLAYFLATLQNKYGKPRQ